MPGLSLPRLRSPRHNSRRSSHNATIITGTGTTEPPAPPLALPMAADDEDNEALAQVIATSATTTVNVDQLRSALCAFLNIEEGRENAEYLNRYIQTFCAASEMMGQNNLLGNILDQSEDEFRNTLAICRLISEQFEVELAMQQQQQQQQQQHQQNSSTEDTRGRPLPPASARTIASLPQERILLADRLNFQHDRSCCPICVEALMDGVVLTRLPCGHLYHLTCAVAWLSRCCSCPECRFELLPTDDEQEDDGGVFEMDRRRRMEERPTVHCSCEYEGMGVHTCFFRDKTKLLCEQVMTATTTAIKKSNNSR